MKTTHQISTVLRKAIEASEMSVHALAQASGVSHPIIFRFMSGERDIRLATADKLAAILGIKVTAK
jgi:ribosome-binding protein aMBF1 (putative translation factor)